MNERNHEPDDRDQDQNLHVVVPGADVKLPLIIGGGMHDDQEESTSRLLGDVLDLVDRATDYLAPDHIEDRLQQVLLAASAAPEDQRNGTGRPAEPGQAPLGEDSQRDPEPMEMVEAARAEAARIVADARREAEQIMAAARKQVETGSAGDDNGLSAAPSTEAEGSPRPPAAAADRVLSRGFGTETEAGSGDAQAERTMALTRMLWHSSDELRTGADADPVGEVRAEQLALFHSRHRRSSAMLLPLPADGDAAERCRSVLQRWLVQEDQYVQRGRIGWGYGEVVLDVAGDSAPLGEPCKVLFIHAEGTAPRQALVYGKPAFAVGTAHSRIDQVAALRRRLRALDWLESDRGDGCLGPIIRLATWPPGPDVRRPASGAERGARIAADVLVPYPVPTLLPAQRIDEAVERMVTAEEYALPVHDGDAVIGIATMSDAVAAASHCPGASVSSVMRRPTVISTATPIDTVRDRILTDSAGLLVVLDDSGSIAGYITARTALAGHVESGDNPSPQSRLVTDLYDPRVILMR
ncbi:CBS domain-containing protein [Actinomadura sp. 7K534]|uniref:CBS domain-containing protein n=1 Tax=Actinomadura sp. 7K534 TaxID=2530366 RepID=UPI0010459136|nr:CBS domain-containing protein [Actinomadura sp. 7K534]TDB92483.1 CBS domain-containing protein [Actinomadura sp. 7K534]